MVLDEAEMIDDWRGTRVLILGAGRQGVALARWLARHNARVKVSDLRNMEELVSERNALMDFDLEWVAGGHPLNLLDTTDLLCLSGGVPIDIPIVKAAHERGIPLSNDTQIFLQAVPCRTIGITGSAGKTTTTTLVGKMAALAFESSQNISSMDGHPKVYIGGNIGDPLINYLDEMQPDDLAILEISSFQLDQMTVSPNIAVLLNLTPNHLDRHVDMAAYTAAKARILEFQQENDVAVIGRDNPAAWSLSSNVKGRLFTFSNHELEPGLDGAYQQNGLLSLRVGKTYLPLLLKEKIKLRGDHNLSNILAAFTIGYAAGFPLDSMLEAVESFQGVPHRLDLVQEINGVRWYNDSIATAPERSIAAIKSFTEPIVLLLGGRDKNLPWNELAELVHNRVDHVVLFGEAAPKIESELGKSIPGKRPYTLDRVADLHQAVFKAAEVAQPGDVVLFSPGGTSFDAFKDFEQRGHKFNEWVRELT